MKLPFCGCSFLPYAHAALRIAQSALPGTAGTPPLSRPSPGKTMPGLGIGAAAAAAAATAHSPHAEMAAAIVLVPIVGGCFAIVELEVM